MQEEKRKEKKRRFNPLFFFIVLVAFFWFLIIGLSSGCVPRSYKEAVLVLDFILADGRFETSDLENPVIEMQAMGGDRVLEGNGFDPFWSSQNLYNVIDVYGFDKGIPKVAVLDGGFQKHIDLDISLVADTWSFVYNSADIWSSGSFEHGLNVMSQIGCISGNDMYMAGVPIQWYLYEVAWSNSAFVDESLLASAVNRAVENEVDFIVLAWGGYGFSGLLASAIRNAYDAGIVVIASSGNSGNIIYPAAWDTVISVGASDMSKATPGGCYMKGKSVVLSRGGIRDAEGTSFAAPASVLAFFGNSFEDIFKWYRLGGYDPLKLDESKVILAVVDDFGQEIYRIEVKPGDTYKYRDGWEVWVLCDRDRDGVLSVGDILGNEKAGNPVRMRTVWSVKP